MRFANEIVPFDSLEAVIIEAGKILKGFYGKSLEREFKSGGSFATEADLAAESYLIEHLKALLPGSGVWAEESGNQLDDASQDLYWVIDPLDGTNNFAQNIPFSCISVALVKQKQLAIGLIYDFHREEMFVASQGNGAYLNGNPIQVSRHRDLDRAMIAAPMAYKGDVSTEVRHLFWDCIQRVDKRCMSIRVLGAAALDIAYVACGRFDGIFIDNLYWWDVAAGALLIQEAGGVVSTYEGNPIDSSFKSLVGGSEQLHHQLKELLDK
ncbi:inositol monophosphatase [bacterium]|nr:inositol monophosphatase [bacterium]MBT5015280.1 inositol monophosphatase [bacterium]